MAPFPVEIRHFQFFRGHFSFIVLQLAEKMAKSTRITKELS
jgi:hypothetical protein